MKQLMTGNEAIALGAWEAGVHVVAAYPGTPSTEVTENAAKYAEIYAEWGQRCHGSPDDGGFFRDQRRSCPAHCRRSGDAQLTKRTG